MITTRIDCQLKPLAFFYRTIPVIIVLVACSLIEARAYPVPEYAVKQNNSPTFYIDFNGDSNADRVINYGAPSFIGLAGDFDGDTITDLAAYDNGTWYIDFFNDAVADKQVLFGGPTSTDTPVVADFNADGKADIAVYRNDGFWYIDYNLDGAPNRIAAFGGLVGDIPVAADFNGDESIDRAIYRQGQWFIDFDFNGTSDASYLFGGGANDIPLAADFNSDGAADLIIFRDGVWYVDFDHDSNVDLIHFYGGAGMRPLVGYFNTANSVFVRAGATGTQNGGQKTPFATINASLATNLPAGTIIRIAVGTYNERIILTQRSTLTFQGSVQGPDLTGTTINPSSGDAFSCFLCTGITLRDLHITSNGPDGSTPGRGVVNVGSSMLLERVGAIGSRNTNVIAAQHSSGTLATIIIFNSLLERSQIGNGLQLETGATATIAAGSSVSGNGTNPAAMPPPPAAPGGRGIVLFGNAVASVFDSKINGNYDGGLLATGTANASLQGNYVNLNGTNGAYFEQQTTGMIDGNVFEANGTRGTRGAGGYNGVEIAGLGATMNVTSNIFSANTLNGIYIGDGTVNVINNNIFLNNFLGMTIDNPLNRPVNVTVKGNTFRLFAGTPYSEGIFMASSTNASLTITIGGSAAADKNTFRDYGSFPAIHCNINTINAQCVTGGNIFINSSFPVQNCPSCSP